ncbi:hypothetical protein MMC07_006784 [Pseudocyphellaria aurata]|nr:hypothetical protein [Pseudocyphellaria aurata]
MSRAQASAMSPRLKLLAMVSVPLISTLFAWTVSATVLRRQTDGSAPAGTVDPSTISDCTYWVNVDSGILSDECSSIESYYGISESQFVLYNPSLKGDCSGLQNGYSYCVEENFGLGPAPKATSAPTATPTSSSSRISSTSTISAGPSPTQSGIISTCQNYYKVLKGDSCSTIVDKFGTFDLDDFYTWNPAVGDDCLSLQVGYFVCVGVVGTPSSRPTPTAAPINGPTPQQPGVISTCVSYYKVQAGDGCQAIVDKNSTFTLDDFYSWNPAVGSSCQSLQLGYYVCVGVPGTPTNRPSSTPSPINGPSPQQSGVISTCSNFYRVTAGDGCQDIVDKYGTFSLNEFYTWNPAVGTSCQSLQAGYYVCVGIPGTPTQRPAPTATPTPKGPLPSQSGIIADCTKYHQAVSGDSCASIVDEFGTFTLAQFQTWNPAVGDQCAHLLLGYYYCIAVPGTPTTRLPAPATPTVTPTVSSGPQPQQPGTNRNCRRYYLVKAGDSCYDIEQSQKVSAKDFLSWNPGVGNDCKGLFLGYYVCIGV